MHIYVVMGQTGEYSDHNEWIVGWVPTEADAKDAVMFLTERYKEILVKHSLKENRYGLDGRDYEAQRKAEEEMRTTWDPAFSLDYTGAQYWYAEVPAIDPAGMELLKKHFESQPAP